MSGEVFALMRSSSSHTLSLCLSLSCPSVVAQRELSKSDLLCHKAALLVSGKAAGALLSAGLAWGGLQGTPQWEGGQQAPSAAPFLQSSAGTASDSITPHYLEEQS